MRSTALTQLAAASSSTRRRLAEARYLSRGPTGDIPVSTKDTPALDLAVVAFENVEALERQRVRLGELLADDYRLIYFDNSHSEHGRRRVRAFARSVGVFYVELPLGNPHTGHDPSASHGLALTWAYRHVLSRTRAPAFGALDPDVFPFQRTSALEHLARQPCFGHLQERGDRWYLWAGLCFYRSDAAKRLDFRPGAGLDTGGRNWRHLYRCLDRGKLEFPIHAYLDEEVVPGRTPERIGDWVHTFNSSSWRG